MRSHGVRRRRASMIWRQVCCVLRIQNLSASATSKQLSPLIQGFVSSSFPVSEVFTVLLTMPSCVTLSYCTTVGLLRRRSVRTNFQGQSLACEFSSEVKSAGLDHESTTSLPRYHLTCVCQFSHASGATLTLSHSLDLPAATLFRETSAPPAAIRIHNLTSSSELIRTLHTTMAEEGQSKRKREEDDDEDTAKAAKEAPPAKHIV